MPMGKKRRVVPTALQEKTFNQAVSFLGERGFVAFPIVAPFQSFAGCILLKKDPPVSRDSPQERNAGPPDPLIIEKGPGGLVRVRLFQHRSVQTRLLRDLRNRFGRRIEFGGQVRLCQKTPWHQYLSAEHLKEWALFAGVQIEDKSRAA